MRRAVGLPEAPNPFHRRLARSLLSRTARQVPASELRRSALVFSPHPDDESLGCGGTILKKKQAGATVKLVLVSDGGGSTTLISKEQLTAMRKQEFRDAGQILGVDDIYCLDFPDGEIGENIPAAIESVADILQREAPEDVFVPCMGEPQKQAADHRAVTRIVLAALRRQPRQVLVWEYPVWFWLHWPWVGFRQNTPPLKPKHILKNALMAQFGARALIDLRSKVDIADVLPQKRAAIAAHKSQTTKLVDDPSWITLDQLSSGELIECFYQKSEFFRRYVYGGLDGVNNSSL